MSIITRSQLFITFLFIIATTFGQAEKQKLIITHLTGGFYVYTTFGDLGDGSLYPANGMYLLTDKGAILFDTPWDTMQCQPLLDSIKEKHQQDVIVCISTHFHSDRTAGLDYYKQKGIKTYTTKLTDSLLKERNEPRAAFLIHQDTTFTIGQYSFETFYPGKGHSPDNIVIWLGKEKILYGGCFIKSVATNSPGNLSDANINEWIQSVEKVQARFGKPGFIVTGHLDWTSKKSLSHTLKLLKTYKQKSFR